ncbi:MAG: hypothetical protein WCO84_06535 [bacterium]
MSNENWVEMKLCDMNVIVMADPTEDLEKVKREIYKRICDLFGIVEIEEEEW